MVVSASARSSCESSSSCVSLYYSTCESQPELDHSTSSTHHSPNQSTTHKRQRDYDASSDIGSSRSKRTRATTSVSSSGKQRVSQAPNAIDQSSPKDITNRCAVTMCTDDTVKAYHIISPDTKDEDLATLEFAWGLQYRSLQLHSEDNTINLTAQLGASFEASGWILIPMDSNFYPSLMLSLFDRPTNWRYKPLATDRVTKLYGDQKVFKYVLFPLEHAKGLKEQLVRYDEHSNPTTHTFPYVNLPIFSSSVQPHFAIYDLGRKLETLKQRVGNYIHYENFDEHKLLALNLTASHGVYKRWMTDDPPATFKEVWGPLKKRPRNGESCHLDRKRRRLSVDGRSMVSRSIDGKVCPNDSISVVELEEREGCEDRGDELDLDETRSVFDARIKEWATDIVPGSPSSSLLSLDQPEDEHITQSEEIDVAQGLEVIENPLILDDSKQIEHLSHSQSGCLALLSISVITPLHL